MSEYTSSLEGFQKAMQWALDGPSTDEDVKSYIDSTTTPSFYQIQNGKRLEGSDYASGIKTWRGKIESYKPQIDQFLRDGDQLSARMSGTIKVDGSDMAFESFMFAKVDSDSGRMEWLRERVVWGPVNEEPTHGTGLTS